MLCAPTRVNPKTPVTIDLALQYNQRRVYLYSLYTKYDMIQVTLSNSKLCYSLRCCCGRSKMWTTCMWGPTRPLAHALAPDHIFESAGHVLCTLSLIPSHASLEQERPTSYVALSMPHQFLTTILSHSMRCCPCTKPDQCPYIRPTCINRVQFHLPRKP